MRQELLPTADVRVVLILAKENILPRSKGFGIKAAANRVGFSVGVNFDAAKIFAKGLPHLQACFGVEPLPTSTRALDAALGRRGNLAPCCATGYFANRFITLNGALKGCTRHTCLSQTSDRLVAQGAL